MIKLSKSGIIHLLEIPNVVKIIRMAIQKLTGTIKDRENKPKIFCKITFIFTFHNESRIGGLMVSSLASSPVDHGVELRSGEKRL
jgi:hypothetical protein